MKRSKIIVYGQKLAPCPCISGHGLINCHGLTFDFLPYPPRHLSGVKGHAGRGTRPPITTSQSWGRGPTSEAWACKCHAQTEAVKPALTRTHTLHTAFGTRPTSLIRLNWLFFFVYNVVSVLKVCFDVTLYFDVGNY